MLDTLTLWQDETPRGGALNMALDEVMLTSATVPWLRVYSWSEPSVSIGFSQALSVVPVAQATWPVVRRWTGGGVVLHDGDWTYTLAVPSNHPVSDQRASDTYKWVHEAIISALDEAGITGCILQPEHTSDGMGVCFVEPARFDIVWHGNKIAGAAQRRTKAGLLHQGSVQITSLPADFAQRFAQQLARIVTLADHMHTEALLGEKARHLASEKYGANTWLHERKAVSER